MDAREQEQIRKSVEEMRKTNKKYAEEVERLQSESGIFGTIIQMDDERAMVAVPLMGVKFPRMTPAQRKQAMPGGTAVMNAEGNIIAIMPPRGPFTEVRIIRHLDDGMTEIERNGENYVIYSGSPEMRQLTAGTTALTDMGGNVLIKELEENNVKPSFTRVSWDDIGGLHRAKEQIIDSVIMPIKNPEMYTKYGRKPPKGLLMSGPPGCGKTLLGRATASALSENGDAMFLYIKSTELLSSYVGMAEASIRSLFAKCRRHKEETGNTAIVFIDEADAILYRRGTGISSDVDRTIVPTFLTEMDGLSESSALVILATNRIDTIDPAVLRDGRMDVKIKVERPDRESITQIMMVVFRNILKADPIDTLVEHGVKEIGRDDYVLRAANGNKAIRLRDIATGAMCANIAGRSAGEAMRRDMTSKSKKASGVVVGDVCEAVKQIYQENLGVVHDYA